MISGIKAYLNPQQLLIEPYERLRFITLYVLATLLANFGARFLSLNVISRFSPEPVSLVDAAVLGTVFGVILGACQWLVIREFIPNLYWIVATATGFCYFQVILQSYQNLVIQLVQSGQLQLQLVTGFLLSLVVTFFATIWLGLLQWLILRYYIKSARWWVLIFPALFLISFAMIVLTNSAQLIFRWNLTVDWNIVFPAILGISQATALCLLKRKVQNNDQFAPSQVNKLLITTPEIGNLRKLWDLSNRLYHQIHKSWEQETSLPARLIYLLGVTETGNIIICQPANQMATYYISQTPLPNLISSLNDDVEQSYHQPLARFLVTFTTLGGLEIRICKSYKLIWITLSLLGFLLLVSTYPTWLHIIYLST
ncbi:hypothetical protein [Anabaena azotica]|uniref:Uncharacterized protein n=1 Tax=Anabaena azotica FACHB-119 TaxID=947527 RepID=A0ABR8D691_9NOST|nr:hypothetical protein [Anabaena azotica]MBD2501263.1 hypothetical protein [Anabaena azotica FACHB-119]